MAFPHTSSFCARISQLPPLRTCIIDVSMSSRQDSRLGLRIPSKPQFPATCNVSHGSTHIQRNSPRKPNFIVGASINNSPSSSKKNLVLINSAITVTFAVASRVLYKLALVPMKDYPFFLAQFTTFGYVLIYFSMLYVRYHAGLVTDEMIALPKSPFMAIGILEALGVATGMAAAAMLPGPAIPLLNQTFLIWQLAFSTIILGRRYAFNQLAGCLLVAGGLVVAVASGPNAGQMLSGVELVWPAIMIASSAFQAGASIIKEFVFVNSANRLKGRSLDIFVVNSFGSGFQALFVLLFLPLLSNLKGIPFAQLPLYLRSGSGCFINIGGRAPGCDGAPLLPLLYITTNIAFNISLLNLCLFRYTCYRFHYHISPRVQV
ncbi:protein CLT2, chloroplastic-like isoform X2 [Tripterygium wilfordii]|uniref:protein CLT2, chloroplastic-like isoform X2 n=1 Tax=Tripterygium wilfordii TaxID=458696 RepID=UPI0018F7F37D|nr:protein CLT2, chloroplastic-like isoform X2 [Tripterygium wilfordii]